MINDIAPVDKDKTKGIRLNILSTLELPVGYYLENFLLLLRSVREQYSDLLLDEEKEFHRQFETLPLRAQRLYVRILSRKGPLLRSDKLHYPEIKAIGRAIEELEEAGFLEHVTEESLDILLPLFHKGELFDLFSAAGKEKDRTIRKIELLDVARETLEPEEVSSFALSRFAIIKPLCTEIVQLFKLLFFGNAYQDLSEFVITDLGLVQYEEYSIGRDERPFSNRESIDGTIAIYELNRRLYEEAQDFDCRELASLAQACPGQSKDPVLSRRRDRTLNAIARQMERLTCLEEALKFYRQTDDPPSRERQVRILYRLRRPRAAFDLAQTVLKNPQSEEERDFAEYFLPRLRRKIGLKTEPHIENPEPRIHLRIDRKESTTVEESCLSYLKSLGCEGYYVENSLWTGLFGLAFWHIIFLPLRGAFYNHFQRGPADLFTPDFRRRRDGPILSRLAEIEESGDWVEQILAVYDQKKGKANHFVNWFRLSREMIEELLPLIPKKHVIAILERMSRDLAANRSGFPDLIVYPPPTELAPTLPYEAYMLVEVKGPNDQVQKNQHRWMIKFSEIGVPFVVAYLEFG